MAKFLSRKCFKLIGDGGVGNGQPAVVIRDRLIKLANGFFGPGQPAHDRILIFFIPELLEQR